MLAAVPASLGATLTAGLVMLVAGLSRKRLAWRTRQCPSCGRPSGSCTCRWR